jgi:photosystem II stability/assembly factor-like uncharacterized protein
MKRFDSVLRACIMAGLFLPSLAAQTSVPAASPNTGPLWKDQLKWRLIGPSRGGRVVAVAGVASQPGTYYFGGVGGGIWKTVDSGTSWKPVADGQLKTSSVGALAVAESDPNIVWAGMGEACIRGNAEHGDGVYKSTDAGETWKYMGLAPTRHIGAVRIHPRNPDIVYVAALGHQFAPNPERGVYRTNDGGKTWKLVLGEGGDKAGAIDLAFDPGNPNVLYAALWQVRRTPWSLESGGPASGIWKSTDGGDTWRNLTANKGLPKGPLGRIGLAVSAADPQRVWAIVEAAEGGVFRSDDAGKTWSRVNDSRNLRQRAWYYTHIFADPKSADTLYVLNTALYKSVDGGKTYNAIRVPHGDNHALWIALDNPQRMINGNDGGANVSNDGGKTWSGIDNQPTAQFYRVTLDNDLPFNIYGAQQDNSTVRIASRGAGSTIDVRDWYDVGGGESGWIAPWPKDSQIVFAGSYGGLLTRYDHRNGSTSAVNVWPDNPMGYGAEGMKYRFQWNFPLLFSPHDSNKLYAGGNILFASTDMGQSWKPISPDLTRNDRSKQGPSGGPITKDNTGVEYYDTIFTVAESPLKAGVIWSGSDDGLVHLTTDGGAHWSNVTPKDLPEWIQINSVEASPHDPAAAYLAATMYKSDDFRPFLYRTKDYGRSWTKIVSGLPEDGFTRVIREDPNRRGLLYAGTELGIHVSFDDGAQWQSLQLNMPPCSITDLAVHKRDRVLVAATQGRSFYALDEIAVLDSLNEASRKDVVRLFRPQDAARLVSGFGSGGGSGGAMAAGQNPPRGVVVYYWLKEKPKDEVTLEFLDSKGQQVRRISSKPPAQKPEQRLPDDDDDEGPPSAAPKAPAEAGLNRFVWDMRYADASRFPGMIMWAGSVRGPLAAPGSYSVRLTAGGSPQTAAFAIVPDPRLKTTEEEYSRQLELALQIRDKLTQTNDAVVRIREVRGQLEGYANRLDPVKNKLVVDSAKALAAKLTVVEEELYQTKNRSSQDPLNFPIRLNNKLAALGMIVQMNDAGPTAQSRQVYEDLVTRINAQLRRLDVLVKEDLAGFNALVRKQEIPAVFPTAVP